MTAPTSPGVVPADDVRELAHRIVLHCQHTAVPEATEIVGKLLMADRANRPSLTEDEREQVRREAAEDQLDRLYEAAIETLSIGVSGMHWLYDYGCMPHAERLRLRALAHRSEPRQEKEGKS